MVGFEPTTFVRSDALFQTELHVGWKRCLAVGFKPTFPTTANLIGSYPRFCVVGVLSLDDARHEASLVNQQYRASP